VTTSLVVGDVAYLWTDQGLISCITAATGEVRWQQRTKPDAATKEGFFASPIWVDGRVFNVSRDGEVVVIEASTSQFKELFRFPLGETAHATPAVSGGRMFLRTESHLFCLGGGKR
jgi:outer membrane protein assembly factor BamB